MEVTNHDGNIAATRLQPSQPPELKKTDDQVHSDSKLRKPDRTNDEDHVILAKEKDKTKIPSLKTEIIHRANPDPWRQIALPIKNKYSTVMLNCKFIDRMLESFYAKLFSNKHQYLKAQYNQKSLLHEVLFRLDAHMIVFLVMLDKLARNDYLSDDGMALYRKLRHQLELAAIQVPNYLAPLVQLIQDYNPDDPNLNETVYLVMHDAFQTHPATRENEFLLAGERKYVTSDIHGMIVEIHRLMTTPDGHLNGNFHAAHNHVDTTAQADEFTLANQVRDIRGELNPLLPGQSFFHRRDQFGDPVTFGYGHQNQWTRHAHYLTQYLQQFNFPPIKVNDLNSMARFYYLDANTDWVRNLNAELNSVYFTNQASASAESLCNFTGNQLAWDIDFNNANFKEQLGLITITLKKQLAKQVRNLLDLSNLTGFFDAIKNQAIAKDLIGLIPDYKGITDDQFSFIESRITEFTKRFQHIDLENTNTVSYRDYCLIRELVPDIEELDWHVVEMNVADDVRRNKPLKYWDYQHYVTMETTENLDALASLQTFQHIMPPVGSNYNRLTTTTRSGTYYNRNHMPVRFTSEGDSEYARFVSAIKPYYSQTRP